jgi:hypothetical protein
MLPTVSQLLPAIGRFGNAVSDYGNAQQSGDPAVTGVDAASRGADEGATLRLDLFRLFLTLTARCETARVFAVAANIVSTFEEYTRLYSDRDVEGVTNLCLWPFLAIRKGEAIHMPDRAAVRDHFAEAIIAYRVTTGVVGWTPVEIDARQLGKHSIFATLHWNAVDADGQVVRDTWTSYQLLATPDGWRFLSYTNHF